MLILPMLGGFLALVAAQQSIQDPVRDFCRRHQHQTCVIDSKLYVDGGEVYYGPDVKSDSQPTMSMFSVRSPEADLQDTWLLWHDLNNISSGLPPQYSNLTAKEPGVPIVKGGVLWPDTVNKLFYIFGGEYATGEVETFTKLWFYDTVHNSWNDTRPHGTQASVSWPSFGASAVNDEGIAYYYGGILSNSTVPGWQGNAIMLTGLLTYDMKSGVWGNQSWDEIGRAEGTLHYLPASDRGMLVYMGGRETSASGVVSYAAMNQIQLFDISASRWYSQTATGDEVPQPRRGFCSGAVWAEDYSSYSIYIYGGIGSNETALGDLWVLSIPSFKWFSLYPDPQRIEFGGGKAWASCDVIQNSQMIVMSGKYTNASRLGCDLPTAVGQHSALLGQEGSELQPPEKWWGGLQSNVTTYQVPDNIVAEIGGGPEGKATATAPAAGWQTSDLANYFRKTYSAYERSATRPIPTSASNSTASSQPIPSDLPPKTNVGAIAGGTVGGAVALVAIVALAWFCLRRRRQTQGTQPTSQVPSNATVQQQGSAAATNEKYVATPTTTSYPSTFPSPHPHTTGYSPQASPPPPSWSDRHTPSTYYEGSPPMPQQTWGTQDMPIQYANQQPYYPPPPEPSQSPSKHAHMASVELPSIRSPATEMAEMPEVRSPVPKRGL